MRAFGFIRRSCRQNPERLRGLRVLGMGWAAGVCLSAPRTAKPPENTHMTARKAPQGRCTRCWPARDPLRQGCIRRLGGLCGPRFCAAGAWCECFRAFLRGRRPPTRAVAVGQRCGKTLIRAGLRDLARAGRSDGPQAAGCERFRAASAGAEPPRTTATRASPRRDPRFHVSVFGGYCPGHRPSGAFTAASHGIRPRCVRVRPCFT